MRVGAIHTVALLILSAVGMYAFQQLGVKGAAEHESQQPERSYQPLAAPPADSKHRQIPRTLDSGELDQESAADGFSVSEYVLEWEQRLLTIQPPADSAPTVPVLSELSALDVVQRYAASAMSGDGRSQYVLSLMFHECRRASDERELVRLQQRGDIDQQRLDHMAARNAQCAGWDSTEVFRVTEGDPHEYWLERAVSAGNPVAKLDSAQLAYTLAFIATENARRNGNTSHEDPEVPPAELVFEALNYAWRDPLLREAAVWKALTYFSSFAEADHIAKENWNGDAGHYKRGALSDGWRLFWCTQTERCELRRTLTDMESYFYLYEIDEAVEMALTLHAAVEDEQWGTLGL